MNVSPVSSLEWHTTPDKWKEPRIFHEPFEPTFEDRIKISRIALNKTAEKMDKKKLQYAPNQAYWYIVDAPDTMKPGPWSTEIKIFNERDYLISVKLIDYAAQYMTTIKWLNEKLLYVQFWWGRIVGSYFILDVEKEKILIKEMVYDGGQAFQQWQQQKKQ
jgi:hypothetical protein